jgi:hypothetical protein
MVRATPSQRRAIQSRVQLLVSRLDGIGLDVDLTGIPWTIPTPDKLLISEAVWPSPRAALKRPLPAAQGPTRDCLRAIEKLAAGGMWAAAQLSLGHGLWLPWYSLSSPSVTESEYNALLAELRVSPHLDRISRERLELRGQRQLTLQESWYGACTTRAIAGPPGPGATQASESDPSTETQHWSRRHPLQCEPGLPDAVVIDCTSHTPSSPPAPPGWTLAALWAAPGS